MKPAAMTSEQLVQQFALLATQQEEAIFADENDLYNTLVDRMEVVESELQGHSGDQRRLLCSLYRHKNNYVRLKAAFATLAVEPELSQDVLRDIADLGDYPATAEARLMLLDLERGSFVPE